MFEERTLETLLVGTTCLGAAAAYFWAARRSSACGDIAVGLDSPRGVLEGRVRRAIAARSTETMYPRIARYCVAAIALAIALTTLAGMVPPVLGYSALCLSMVAVFIADLAAEERARRIRVASLAPRRVPDPTPLSWAIVAVASTLLLFPYVANAQTRIEALIVGAAALAMAAVTWRIASAPTQFAGTDFVVERIVDGGMRARRAGLAATLAVGAVFVFASFANIDLQKNGGSGGIAVLASLIVWILLWAWSLWYVRHVFGSLKTIAQ